MNPLECVVFLALWQIYTGGAIRLTSLMLSEGTDWLRSILGAAVWPFLAGHALADWLFYATHHKGGK